MPIPSAMVKYISDVFKNDSSWKEILNYNTAIFFDWEAAIASLMAMMQCWDINIANTFNVGYAHDFTKTDLRTYDRGTHEIMIGFLPGNHNGDTCPGNV